MRPFSHEELKQLIAAHDAPCVSLTMPTHRRLPEASHHPVQYSNLVRQAAGVLEKKYGKRDDIVPSLIAKLESLGGEDEHPEGIRAFWNHQKDGLAVFASPDLFACYRVPVKLREIVVVADTFHVKPLLPLLYTDQRFQVLSLTVGAVVLYEGGADHLEPLVMDGVPTSIDEALGADVKVERAGLAAHGGKGPGTGSGIHGYGKGSDDDKEELRRYFRAVERGIEERQLRNGGAPLILAAVDYYHPLFQEVSRDRNLLKKGITLDPVGMTREQVHAAALAIFAPVQQQKLAAAVEEFGSAQAWKKGSADLAEIGLATAAGRTKCLLLEEKRRLWGRVRRDTGELALGGHEGNADDVDVLDDLAELTLLHGGEVLIVPREQMPTNHGAAAIYRY